MTPHDLRARLHDAALLPVLTVHDGDVTLRTVEALVEGGIKAIEIVLRTPAAEQAIAAVRLRFPALLVAAGTVVSPSTFDSACATGADLLVTPGLPASLIAHHRTRPVSMVPGVLSATEVMNAREAGFTLLKYYPAVPSNGSVVLEDYAHLFPEIGFVPTGKIGFETLSAFARLKNVVCIGGSWMHTGPVEAVADKVARSLDLVRAARTAV